MALVKEDAPAVESQDKVLPPSKRSLLSPCSISASEMSYLRYLSKTSFLRGQRLVDPPGGAEAPLAPAAPSLRPDEVSELVPVGGEELRLPKQWLNCQTN